MTLLHPTYLWGLLALAVPLAIHLWSKKEGKTIKVGSIQLLTETNSKQASSIQINELLLLLLRFLLLALVVFILCEPHWKLPVEKQDIVYVIEPALLENTDIRAMIDSLPDGSTRLLQTNFPEWNPDQILQNEAETPKYWQSAQEMNTLNADSVVVFTRALFQGINGKRPAVNTSINWVVLNPGIVENQAISAEKIGDSIKLISVDSDSDQLTFNTEKISQSSTKIVQNQDSITLLRSGKSINLPLTIQDTLQVQMVASDSLAAEEKYIAASFRAIGAYIDRPIKLSDENDSVNRESDVLVWLKNETPPKISGKILSFKPTFFAQNLINPTENRRVYNLTRRLNSENVIAENLPEQLIKMLNLHPDLNEKLAPYDFRSISKDALQVQQTKSKPEQNRAQFVDLSIWFWLALFSVFITERIISFYRKQ